MHLVGNSLPKPTSFDSSVFFFFFHFNFFPLTGHMKHDGLPTFS